ncbi:hypothetical protein AOLI_G00176000 [Acnodon oligacanthus]
MDTRTRSVKWQVRMLEQQLQQSEESSSLLQNDSSTHPASQQQPQEHAEEYISDTFTYIKTVEDFCDTEPAWTRQRESEVKKMRDIKSSADKLFNFFNIKELKKELGEVLTDTRKGLKDLQPFLDAVERLAVTSPFVFMDKSFPLRGENAEAVRSVVSAKIASPLLIHFKRDDGTFFLPELDNVELLVHRLTKYVCIIKWICKEMKTKDKSQVTGNQDDPSQLSLSTSLSMENVSDLSQLSRVRMEESFRLRFLVTDQDFAKMYNKRHSEMTELLSRLEKNAVGLDRMKDVYSVLTIIGSFLGIVGAILSIISSFPGLAIFPAAISLTLKWTGGANAGALLADLFSFCKESCRIVTRKKSKTAQLIRSNIDLWCSEIKAWKSLHDSLFKGVLGETGHSRDRVK